MRSTMNSQYVETDDGQVVFLDFEVCGEGDSAKSTGAILIVRRHQLPSNSCEIPT